jgi:hypothetical protein
VTRMRMITRLLACAALVGTAASCGDVVRTGRSPVILVINSLTATPGGGHGAGVFSSVLLSDVVVLLNAPPPCTPASPCPTIFNDSGQLTLSLALKDIGNPGTTLQPTTNNAVTVNRIHVEYIRADGRNTPGVDVPYAFDGAATGTVPATGQLVIGFEIVKHVAKEESPLVQLRTSQSIITTIARVTVYGRDMVGNDISATGQIQIDFGNFGDS